MLDVQLGTQSRQYLDVCKLTAMAALMFLAFFIVLGVAAALGRTPDTRDPEFSLGRVTAPHITSTVHPVDA